MGKRMDATNMLENVYDSINLRYSYGQRAVPLILFNRRIASTPYISLRKGNKDV